MRVLAVLMILLVAKLGYSQDNEPANNQQNELSLNAFELIVGGVLPINYERYLKNNQSLGIKAFIFDKHYNDMSQNNYGTFSLQAQYMIYFSDKRDHPGLYTAPFLKYTTGTASNEYYSYSQTNQSGEFVNVDYSVNALLGGFEVGYKFVIKRNFTFALAADLGRVLNQGDYYGYNYSNDGLQADNFNEYGPVEFRFGINMGYRF
jgi:hypothetical protein